jgi:hypothetical protein
MTLRSEVRDLRTKLREFYDEYSRFTTSKVYHQDHAHKHAPTPHVEEIVTIPTPAPVDDNLSIHHTESIIQPTEPVMVALEETTIPTAPIMQDLPIRKSTKVVDTGPSYFDIFLDWFKVDWPMKI